VLQTAEGKLLASALARAIRKYLKLIQQQQSR
jgi:hypothetical protein